MSGSNSLLNSIAHPSSFSPDIMDAYGQGQHIAGQINQNRLFQSQQAAGNAFLQSIKSDGSQDVPGLALRMQANPNTALAAQDVLAGSQKQSDYELNQAVKRMGIMTGMAAPLLASGQPISKQQWIDTMKGGVGSHGFSVADIDKNAATIPDATPQNPYAVNDWLRGHVTAFINPEQRTTAFGNQPQVSTGDGTAIPFVPTVPPNRGSAPPPQAIPPIPARQSASDLNTLVQIGTNPDGSKRMGTQQQAQNMAAGRNPDDNGPASASSPLGTGRPPPTLRNPTATPAPTAQPGFTVGNPTGTDKEQEGSAGHAVEARERANHFQSTIQPVELALTSLDGADTGKGAETLNSIRAYTQDLAPAFIQRMLPDTLNDREKRVKFEEANKALTQTALAAPGGTRSNQGQDAASAASPSVHIANETAQLIGRAVLAQHRMQQAGILAFDRTGKPGQEYDKFMNQWMTTADPRAFVVDKMMDAERGALVKSMGGLDSDAYKKFKKSYRDAVDGEVIIEHAGK